MNIEGVGRRPTRTGPSLTKGPGDDSVHATDLLFYLDLDYVQFTNINEAVRPSLPTLLSGFPWQST